MTFTVRQAQIVGLFIETLLYGMHIIAFGVCLRCLLWDIKGFSIMHSGQVKRGMLAMSMALFVISTLDVAMGVVNDYNGLVSPGGQDTLNTPNWLTVSRTVLLGIQNIIGDSIWVYRCWIIYERRWAVVALPIVFFFAVLGISFAVAGLEPSTVPGPLPLAGRTTLMIAVVYGISFVSSLLTTVLIVARLRRVDRDLRQYEETAFTTPNTTMNTTSQAERPRQPIPQARARSRLGTVMILVVESGLMFTATEFFCMLSFALKSNLCYIATYMDIQIIPIAFNLIVIRLHMSRDEPGNSTSRSDERWSVAQPDGSSRGTYILRSPIASHAAEHELEGTTRTIHTIQNADADNKE